MSGIKKHINSIIFPLYSVTGKIGLIWLYGNWIKQAIKYEMLPNSSAIDITSVIFSGIPFYVLDYLSVCFFVYQSDKIESKPTDQWIAIYPSILFGTNFAIGLLLYFYVMTAYDWVPIVSMFFISGIMGLSYYSQISFNRLKNKIESKPFEVRMTKSFNKYLDLESKSHQDTLQWLLTGTVTVVFSGIIVFITMMRDLEPGDYVKNILTFGVLHIAYIFLGGWFGVIHYWGSSAAYLRNSLYEISDDEYKNS